MNSNPFLANNPFVNNVSSAAVASPRVNDEDLDLGAKTALEVKIMWGDQTLFITHLSPARDVFVGDESEGPVDYKLPTPRVQIARVEGDSIVAITDDGTLPLTRGQSHTRNVGEMTVRIASVAAAKAPPRGNKGRKTALAWWGASAALHMAIVAGLTMSPGASLDDETAALDKSTAAYMMALQKNVQEKEIVEQEPESGDTTSSGNSSAGAAHAGASGQMGNPAKNVTGGHYAVQGPADSVEVKLAKTHALIESNRYGAIGALASVFGATSNAPVSFNGGDESIGRDPLDFNGNLAGDHAGDSFGYNGLGPTGTGPGGGGWFDGVGLNKIGDFGHACVGGACGNGTDWSTGPGGKAGKYVPKGAPKMYDPGVETTGKLPPEAIKRVIRANFPRFRACYETGLKKDPGLKGTVSVRFIIDTTGAVESASLSGGSMSDSGVSSCVLGVYKTVSFPEPESGKVMVNYPIDFQSGE
jgi:hypothetical protein